MGNAKNEQAEKNKVKYKRPPTIQEINEHIKFMGMTTPHFEKYFGISHGTIWKIRCGERELPAQFWAIIFKKQQNKPRGSYKKKSLPKSLPNNLSSESQTNKLGAPNNSNSDDKTGVLNKLRDITG